MIVNIECYVQVDFEKVLDRVNAKDIIEYMGHYELLRAMNRDTIMQYLKYNGGYTVEKKE